MKTRGSFSLAIVLALLALVHARSAEADSQGILGCGGFHSLALSGNELRQTLYRFRNFNSDRTLTINQITIYAADGSVLATLAPGGFPAGFNPILGPNQTAGFSTSDVFGSSASLGLLQAVVNWETDRNPANALYGVTLRVDNARDAGTGAIGQTRGRDITDCIALR